MLKKYKLSIAIISALLFAYIQISENGVHPKVDHFLSNKALYLFLFVFLFAIIPLLAIYIGGQS